MILILSHGNGHSLYILHCCGALVWPELNGTSLLTIGNNLVISRPWSSCFNIIFSQADELKVGDHGLLRDSCKRVMNFIHFYLAERIVQELNAKWAETVVSGSLMDLMPVIMQKGNLACEPLSLVLLPCPTDPWNGILGVSCYAVSDCGGQ